MKKNDVILILSALTGSCLVYKQAPGINYLLFNLILVALLYYFNRPILQLKTWLIYAASSLLASSMIFVINSELSMFAAVLSYFILVGKSNDPSTSVIIAFLESFMSFFKSNVSIIEKVVTGNPKSKYLKRIYTWLAIFSSVLVALIFLWLYTDASPLFKIQLNKINLKWLDIRQIFFAIFLFFSFYSISPIHPYLPLIHWDSQKRKKIFQENSSNEKSITIGFASVFIPTLFILINLMLLFINILDIENIFISQILPKELTLSDFVHHGVWSLVFSILLAILVIQLLYKPNGYDRKKSKWIKTLLLLWISQSLILIFSTLVRNSWYVEGYGLTYLRIGVFVFLTLAIIGLFWTAVQIKFERSSWQLMYMNLESWFFVLIASTCINWDVHITQFNLKHSRKDHLDWYYLLNLSDANIPLLIKYDEKTKIDMDRYSLEDKIIHSKKRLNRSRWQNYNLRDQQLKSILYPKNN